MHQIHLIDLAGSAKFTAAAAGVGDLGVFLLADHIGGVAGESGQSLGNGGLSFCQIHDGQGGGLTGALLGTGIHEIIDDDLTQLHSRDGGVVGKLIQPAGVIPADAGFGFLTGDHVVGVVGQHQRSFRGGHQTGIEAHKVEFDLSIGEGLVNTGQIHGTVGSELFIIAEAADGAAAVIPEDQSLSVGGIILGAPADEGGQGLRLGHGLAAQLLFQTQHAVVLDLPDLIGLAADHIVLPLVAAAGVDDQIDLVADGGIQHFLQVCGGHAAAGFQIGAAHIDHDGHFVFAITQNAGVLVAGIGDHGGIQRAGVVGTAPAGGDAAAAQVAQNAAQIYGRSLFHIRTAAVVGNFAHAAQQAGKAGTAAEDQRKNQDNDFDQSTAAAGAAGSAAALGTLGSGLRSAGAAGNAAAATGLGCADRAGAQSGASAPNGLSVSGDILFPSTGSVWCHRKSSSFCIVFSIPYIRLYATNDSKDRPFAPLRNHTEYGTVGQRGDAP